MLERVAFKPHERLGEDSRGLPRTSFSPLTDISHLLLERLEVNELAAVKLV